MFEPTFTLAHVPLALAAACTLLAASCRRMTWLRAFSLASALLLLVHGALAQAWPSLVLGLLLAPTHGVRLWLHRRAVAFERSARARSDYRHGPALPVPLGTAMATRAGQGGRERAATPKAARSTGFGGLPMADVAAGQNWPTQSANAAPGMTVAARRA
jgi:hypothetical protein